MEKRGFNWSDLIGPGITLLIVLAGVLITFGQLQTQTVYSEKDLKTVKNEVTVVKKDVGRLNEIAIMHTEEIKNIKLQIPTLSVDMKEVKSSVQDMKIQQTEYQSKILSDIGYIKEAIIELKEKTK